MTTENFNWGNFYHSIYLTVSVGDVYKYVATAEGICQWFIGFATYQSAGVNRNPVEQVQLGDQFNWKWLAKDFELSGKILECQSPNLLKFTFGPVYTVTNELPRSKPDWVSNRISFVSDAMNGGITIRSRYAALSGSIPHTIQASLRSPLWSVIDLKSVIEHGNDLRETEVDNEALINR